MLSLESIKEREKSINRFRVFGLFLTKILAWLKREREREKNWQKIEPQKRNTTLNFKQNHCVHPRRILKHCKLNFLNKTLFQKTGLKAKIKKNQKKREIKG